MAKVNGPLFSLEARGKIGDSLVYFPWKGINAVREYVTPANPNTQPQRDQRGYLTDAVDRIHDAQAAAVRPFTARDVTAYAELARLFKASQTWFNEASRQYVNQRVASLFGCIYKGGLVTPAVDSIIIQVEPMEDEDSANAVTAGSWYYGTSPSALLSTWAATFIGGVATDTITGLTTGVKYYFQFRPTAHADFVGTRSGIYHGTPT